MVTRTHRSPRRCCVPTLTKRRSTLADYEVATVATPPVDDRIVHQVLVAEIQPSPRNPRHRLEGIDELAASIAEHQLLQPVVVRRRGRSGYELIAGHRRLEAVKKLGWTEIPAVVRDETSAKAYILTLVENLQREDLTPRELSGIASGTTNSPALFGAGASAVDFQGESLTGSCSAGIRRGIGMKVRFCACPGCPWTS